MKFKALVFLLTVVLAAGSVLKTNFSDVADWSIQGGSGSFEPGGILEGYPYIVVQYDLQGSHDLEGCNVTITVESLNASSWSLYLRITQSIVIAVFSNETEDGYFSISISEKGTFTHVLLRVDVGAVDFGYLIIDPGESITPDILQDWDNWFYEMQHQNPWILPVGALLGVVFIALISFAPFKFMRRKKRLE